MHYFEFTPTCRPDAGVLCMFWLGLLPVPGRIDDKYMHRECTENISHVAYPLNFIDYWAPLPLPNDNNIIHEKRDDDSKAVLSG